MTQKDQGLLDSVMPKFYEVIDRGGGDTAGMILERIDEIQKEGQSERVMVMLEYIEDEIEANYRVGKYIVAKSSTPVLYTYDFSSQFGGSDGVTLNFDRYGEIDAVEFVALP